MERRRDGHWGNTQDNCWVVMALDRYFQVMEGTKPDFNTRISVGKQFCGEIKDKGYTTDTHELDVPLPYIYGPGTEPREVEDPNAPVGHQKSKFFIIFSRNY